MNGEYNFEKGTLSLAKHKNLALNTLLPLKRCNGYHYKNLTVIQLGKITKVENKIINHDFFIRGLPKCNVTKITYNDKLLEESQSRELLMAESFHLPIKYRKRIDMYLFLVITNKGEHFYTVGDRHKTVRNVKGKRTLFVLRATVWNSLDG